LWASPPYTRAPEINFTVPSQELRIPMNSFPPDVMNEAYADMRSREAVEALDSLPPVDVTLPEPEPVVTLQEVNAKLDRLLAFCGLEVPKND